MIKSFNLIILFVAGVLGESLLDTIYDPMEKSTTIKMKEKVVLSHDDINGIVIYAYNYSSSKVSYTALSMDFVSEKGMCVDESPEILIMFEDSSVMELKGNNYFNCDGKVFRFLNKEICDGLSSKIMIRIRLAGYSSIIEQGIPKSKGIVLQNSIKELSKFVSD